MKHPKTDQRLQFPYASELITDVAGKISKVVLDFGDYESLIMALEDAGLLRAMSKTKKEKAIGKDDALAYLRS